MLRIEWDKGGLEWQINKWHNSYYTILDYGIPIFVYVDDIEISGLKEPPLGDVTYIITFFPELLAVIQIFDPELKKRYPFNEGGIQRNQVDGGGFEFTFDYDNKTDALTINYVTPRIPSRRDWHKITIPLKDYVEGVLRAAKEIIADFQRFEPEKSVDDDGVLSLQLEYNTIRQWYEERYHEPVEKKYVVPARFYP
jgi:hypothetical protein